MEKPAVAISDHFADPEDPTIDHTKLRQLLDLWHTLARHIWAGVCSPEP